MTGSAHTRKSSNCEHAIIIAIQTRRILTTGVVFRTKQINQFQKEYDNLRIDVETSGEMMSQAGNFTHSGLVNRNLKSQKS